MNVQMRDTTSSQTQNSTGSSPDALIGGSTTSSFMQLLMTELQSQDPMAPMDTDTFVSQLVNLNMLDQVTQINQTVQSLVSPLASNSQ